LVEEIVEANFVARVAIMRAFSYLVTPVGGPGLVLEIDCRRIKLLQTLNLRGCSFISANACS